MFSILQRRTWRGAVGLIAAYASVLQAFLAYSIAAQAAAHGTSGTHFVICAPADNAAAPGDAGAPVQPTTHCPICTLTGSSAATLPDPILLPGRQPGVATPTPFVSIAACLAFHSARAGLSRAPPQTV